MTIQKPVRLALVVAAALAGCAQIIGFPDYGTGGTGGTGGAATATSSTTGTSTSTSTTGTTTTTSSTTGTGATGGGDAGCTNGAPCYDGPPETEGIGACRAGTLSCGADGGACTGEVRPSLELCTTAGADENCDGVSSCNGQLRWATQIPGAATADAVAAGADGTISVAGTLLSGAAFAYVDALDARGRSCWGAPTSLGTGTAVAAAVALSGAGPAGAAVSCPGSGLVASTVVAGKASGAITFTGLPQQASTGGFDAFVALVDPTGKVAWGQLFGSAMGDDAAAGVTATPDGYVYVTGSAAGALDLSCAEAPDAGASPGAGAFVAKLKASDHTCVWSELWTSAMPAAGTSVAVDDAGAVFVAGTFAGTLDLGGGQQLMTAGANSTFVVKLTADGSFSAATSYQGGNTGSVHLAVGAGASPQAYVAGTVANGLSSAMYGLMCGGQPSPQAYLLDMAGTFPVTPTYACYAPSYDDGGAGATTAWGVAVDRAGNVVLALGATGDLGNPQGYLPAPLVADGLVVAKFASPYHAPMWQTPLTTKPIAITDAALAVDGLGNVVVAGTGSGALDFTGEAFDGGSGSAFVVELSP